MIIVGGAGEYTAIYNAVKTAKLFPENSLCIYGMGKSPSKIIGSNTNTVYADYDPIRILPEDTIKAVLDGTKDRGDLIDDLEDGLKKFDECDELSSYFVRLLQLVSISTTCHQSDYPNIIFICLSGDNKRDDLIRWYLKKALGYFGLTYLGKSDGELNKFTKVFSKTKKKKFKSGLWKLVNSGKHEFREKGQIKFDAATAFYCVELQAEILADSDSDSQFKKKELQRMGMVLYRTITATNVDAIPEGNGKKEQKKADKIRKRLVRKNKEISKYARELVDIIEEMDEIRLPKKKKMPKFKVGIDKNDEFKCDKDKFDDFFLKKSHRQYMLPLFFGHIAARLHGFETGSGDYNKEIKPILERADPEVKKEFMAIIKKMASAS